jgi:transposase
MLLTALYSLRSERQFCEQLNYNCRFSRAWDRWFLTSFPPFATG